MIGLTLSLAVIAGAGTWLWTGGPLDEPKLDWPSPEGEYPAASESYRTLLIREPVSPERWCDLAEALEEEGNLDHARYAIERAVGYGPSQPAVLLRAAEYYQRAKMTRPALDNLAAILHWAPEYDEDVFAIFEQMELGPDEILGRGVRAEPRPAQAYLRRLMETDDPAPATKAWSWIAEHKLADDRLADQYANYLLGRRQYESAADAWAGHLGQRGDGYRRTNYLFNSDFERDPVGTALDWTLRQVAGVESEFGLGSAYSGDRSLCIRFLGQENVEFHHVSQRVVLPAGSWRLKARVRSKELTTDQGVRLRVFDAESPARLDHRTEPVRESTDWQEVSLPFSVAGGPRLIQVEVARQASLKIDNKISGTVWVDTVQLERVQ